MIAIGILLALIAVFVVTVGVKTIRLVPRPGSSSYSDSDAT
jgi:hypothetical protein